MEFHAGRLIDHIHLRVADLEKSRAFYRAALAALGREITHESERHFSADELFVDAADGYVTRVHLAFQTDGHEMVKRFYDAALAAGGALLPRPLLSGTRLALEPLTERRSTEAHSMPSSSMSWVGLWTPPLLRREPPVRPSISSA